MHKILDLAGQTYGNWQVISLVGRVKGQTIWWCECLVCHRNANISGGNLRGHAGKNCKYCKPPRQPTGKAKNLDGRIRTVWLRLKSMRLLDESFARYNDFKAAVGQLDNNQKIRRLDVTRPFGVDNWEVVKPRLLPDEDKAALLLATGINRKRLISRIISTGVTLQTIADALGLTRERVRQLGSTKTIQRKILKLEQQWQAVCAKERRVYADLQAYRAILPPGDKA